MLVSDKSGALRASSRASGFIGPIGALLCVLFAFEAAALPPSPPFGLPDKGVLRLQLGGGQSSRFLHVPPPLPPQTTTSQSIGLRGKCEYLSTPSLAKLTAAGGLELMGLGPDSIGVFDGPKGVACYRITASLGESVKFGLGTTTTSPTGTIGANAFYRLELDIEVKQNAAFRLDILAGDVLTDQFYLRTGTSIVAGQGSTELEYPGASGSRIFNCTAQSDSGPDAGSRDNCRWIVKALGQEFRLVPMSGEGSLEGGGDFGTAAFANNTLIYLTEAAIGELGCGPSSNVPLGTTTSMIGDGVNDAQCTITRIDPSYDPSYPPYLGGTCTTAIGYLLRNIGGEDEGCEMLKSPGEQLAASANILFPPEPSTSLGAVALRTQILFSSLPGLPVVPFEPERCIGTVVEDRNTNRTILEVLSDPDFVDDVVLATPQKDWACILDNIQEYIGAGQMQIRQTILFWGDIEIKRQ